MPNPVKNFTKEEKKLVEKTLKKAIVYLKKGWVQGVSKQPCKDGGFCYCASGAIYEAAKELKDKNYISIFDPEYSKPKSVVDFLVNKIMRKYDKDVISYNDARGRKVEDVIDIFKKGIELVS